MPWLSADVAAAGTVHLADSIDELTRCCADLSTHMVPARPFVLLCGQLSHRRPHSFPGGDGVALRLHPCAVPGGWRRRRRFGQGRVGPGRPRGLRTASRDGSSNTHRAFGARSRPVTCWGRAAWRTRRKPGRWRHQRGDVRPPPAADLPARAGARAARNAAPGVVPGVVLSSSRWRRARRLRGECGPGGPDGPAAPSNDSSSRRRCTPCCTASRSDPCFQTDYLRAVRRSVFWAIAKVVELHPVQMGRGQQPGQARVLSRQSNALVMPFESSEGVELTATRSLTCGVI